MSENGSKNRNPGQILTAGSDFCEITLNATNPILFSVLGRRIEQSISNGLDFVQPCSEFFLAQLE
jgi:hypothetical protein